MNIKVYKNGYELTPSGVMSVISSLNRDHASFIGRNAIGKVKHSCKERDGCFMGEGVCFLYKFVEERDECKYCRHISPMNQLNWFFDNFFSYNDYTAEWEEEYKPSNFSIETEKVQFRFDDCLRSSLLSEVEERDDIQEVL